MDPAIRWNEAEGYPLADRNPYVGPQAVGDGVFARLLSAIDDFTAVPSTFIDGGDHVVVLGRYGGRGQLNLSKKPLAAERFSEIRTQHFDRDFPIVLEVVGHVDHGHTARAEFAVEAIAIGECIDQRDRGVHAARVL